MRDMGQPFNHEEQLFFRNKPGLWPLYEQLLEQIIRLYPSTIVQVKNTQISFIDKHLYACVSFLRFKRAPNLPKDYFVLTLGMPSPVTSQRLMMVVEPYPGRFTTHIPIGSMGHLGSELFIWLDKAHQFALDK